MICSQLGIPPISEKLFPPNDDMQVIQHASLNNAEFLLPKTTSKLAVGSIKLMTNKRDVMLNQMRRHTPLLLRSGRDATSQIRKWKVLCFRHESSSGIPESELTNNKLFEESKLIERDLDRPGVVKKDLVLSFKEKWKVLCFIHESSSFGIPESELTNNKLSEESKLIEHDLDRSGVVKKDLILSFKEAVDAIIRIPGKPWTVPWSAETILQVMLLWIGSFWFVGSWIIPLVAHVAGFSKESLTYRGQALYSLLTDVAEGLAGIAILHRCLSRFRPLPSDWFRFSLKGNWQFDVGLGCLMFPLVNRLSQVNLNLVPQLSSAPVTISSVEHSIVARDPVAMVLYAIVVSVCAPVWEEIVFRGFLLPSLTRYMPVWCSILVSAMVFALAHFNAQRMLPLIFLGVVMGAVFTRSRNLFASMLLHSLWNGFVFLDLMK